MHPLKTLLFVSVVIAVGVAAALATALERAGAARPASIILGAAAFFAFMLPWLGVTFWAMRRATDLDTLVDRARAAAQKPRDIVVTDRPFHAELGDLARAIEALRAANVRQRQAHEEHRAAMDEIVASLGEGLLAVDPKGRVVVANARVAEMFGGAEALVGRAMVEVVRKQPVVAALDKALRGEASVDRPLVRRLVPRLGRS